MLIHKGTLESRVSIQDSSGICSLLTNNSKGLDLSISQDFTDTKSSEKSSFHYHTGNGEQTIVAKSAHLICFVIGQSRGMQLLGVRQRQI